MSNSFAAILGGRPTLTGSYCCCLFKGKEVMQILSITFSISIQITNFSLEGNLFIKFCMKVDIKPWNNHIFANF